jgi:hypothetical protein
MKKLIKIMMFLIVGIFLISCQPINQVNESDIKYSLSKEGYTAEQINVKRRIELGSDPNKIWWIYCLTDTGQVVFYGAVKGKVTSSEKRLALITKDGTDGESDKYVYWFTPSGTYRQWNGKYFLTSEEVKINNVVLNMREVH